MSDEEKRNVEILNNIKEYMQNSIDSGHHKFIYNDLDWDEKCIDIINAIDYFIERVDNQQEEIVKYKRFFKLAISDLQSEGFMQMPYESIEKYYSERGDFI